jgi:tripartite-type tricarboxylate transporter receptor subunit TctC
MQAPGGLATIEFCPVILGDTTMKTSFTLARRAAVLLVAAAVLPPHSSATEAVESYPSKPITFVVPYAAGSGSDQWVRIIGQQITKENKVPVVIDNRPGASGFIGAQQAARAAPDGYTILLGGQLTHALNQLMFKKLPYDPMGDFTPLTLAFKSYNILLVTPTYPAKNVADLVAAAKKAPGKLSFGAGTPSTRIAAEMFRQAADVDFLHVPYKSTPPAITDLLGGQVDFAFADPVTAGAQTRGGKLRALAVSGTTRMPDWADVPTMEEAGIKGYDWSIWIALYLPKGMDPALTNRVNAIIRKAMATPEAREFAKNNSLELAPTSPEELTRFQAAEVTKIARVLKRAGIEPE